jgi:hypothetical protein
MEIETEATTKAIKEKLAEEIEQDRLLKQEIQSSIKEKKIKLKKLDLTSKLRQVKCKNPKCNKIFDALRKDKLFCSEKCRQHYNTAIQYEKLRYNEDYKKKRNEKNRKYYEENKEMIKPKMREYGMKYFFRKREEKKIEEEKRNLKEEDGNKGNDYI